MTNSKAKSKVSAKITVLSVLLVIAALALILTAGCTANPAPATPATTAPTAAAQDTTAPTEVQTAAPTEKPAETNGPKYTAGMIVTNGKGTMKLIGEYNPKTERYLTRNLMEGRDGEAYVIKDGSFKELGSDYDNYKSFEQMYQTVHDDLNVYTVYSGDYYNFNTKNGQRIMVYANNDKTKIIGYLIPSDALTMDFVNENQM